MGRFKLNVFLILSIHLFTVSLSLASTIKLENGQYNGIIIGIDGEKVSSTQCKTILENLKVLLPLFSGNLFEATEQQAIIGEINVLLPENWNDTICNLNAADIHDAKPNESFRNSHVQITQNHSLAESLPWTRQYRPCGQPGDSIVIPLSFLDNPNITESIKAQLLLHEWAKFRYGVFDEFGYEQDEHQIFSPCYTFGSHAHFTSCSSPALPAVVQNASVCSLEFLAKYSLDLIKKLGEGPTSVMSFPYLQNFTKFCNADTHNGWAPTKQNLYCNRKSVGEVVFSHSDFVQRKQPQNKQDPVVPQPPKLGYLRHRHSSEYNPAYIIVIEDSQDMREQCKILHVKQAMAQFLEILEDNTKVHLIIFSGDTINQYSKTLKGDEDRAGLLSEIPDVSSEGPADPQHQRSVSQVIDKLLEIFNNERNNSWHVLLFADSSPVNDPITTDFSEDIKEFGSTSHTISIFTFENTTESNSQEWLEWYSIPNTRNVVALPFCTLPTIPGGPCSFQTSSFILDQIVGNLNDQQFNLNRPRFIQTLDQVSIPNVAGEVRNFNLEGDLKMVKRLYLFMTLPTVVDDDDISNYIQIVGIDESCDTTNLLSYGHVIKFAGCTYKSGQWTLKVIKQVLPGSRPLLLNIFVEMDDEKISDRLIVTPSLNTSLSSNELLPNQNIYPVYVSLQTQLGNPVLYAQVTLHIFHPNLFTGSAQGKINGSVIVLRDDGSSNGPDQTGNDGIYSGYLSGFSSASKTFHLVQLQVMTSSNTLIMNSSIPSKAVLLNEKLTNKCCGKMIHELGYSSFQPPNIKFQMLHFGFKTKEIWSKLLFPPGSIETISILENNDNTVVIEFDAVAGDNTGNDTIIVSSYEACCVPSNSTESMQTTPYPDESSCKRDSVECDIIIPPTANDKQKCSMNKENLVKLWVPAEDQKLVRSLMCAIRAINSNGEFGSLSQEFVEVTVTQTIDKLMGGEEIKCDNLFDDKCLPFWVFWVLIGCLAGVLVVLLVVVCCWCCAARKKRKETTSTVESGKHPPKPTKENVLAVHYSPHPQQQRQFKNHTNQSSVEDVNVEDESKVVKEIFVNHAYIQDGDGEIKIIADNGQILRKPKSDSSLAPIEENPNMQVFKPVPMPTSRPSRMPRTSDHARSRGRRQDDRLQIVHSNPMLRSDSSYNSLERPSLAQQQQQQLPPQFIPPTRNTDPALVYATISRTGRLNNQQHVSSPQQLTFDPHYMVPHNSVPLPPQPTSRQLARESALPRSPPKVPNYPPPISDSETSTDFDMRRRGGARRLPPQFTKPPPYPEGSQLVTVAGQQTPASNDSVFRRGVPVQSRPVNPPVPPPRFDRQTGPVNIRTRNNGSIKTFSSKQEMVSSGEDDSDEWDDGDNYEFQNTTGVSYA